MMQTAAFGPRLSVGASAAQQSDLSGVVSSSSPYDATSHYAAPQGHYIISDMPLGRSLMVYSSDFATNGTADDKAATPSTTGGGPSPDFDRQLGAPNMGSTGNAVDQLISGAGGSFEDTRHALPARERPQQQQVVDLRRQLCDQNLFIFHLPSDWREAELKEAFASFGNILSAKVVKRPDGSSKGYGFVCFEHQQDALAAAAQMNGFSVGGKRLKVSLKKTPEECLNLQVKKLLEMAEQNEAFDRDRDCSLFVFHLPPHWDDKDLRDKFMPFGPVVAAKVSRKEDGTSRGYGFVTCSDPRSAAMAILNLNGLEVCNKRLKVQPKQMGSGTHPRPDCTIFVFHLPNDWTDAVLRQFFSGCGRVVSATVQRDPKGRSRGFGFVTFDRTQSARDAVAEMNGVSVGIKRLKVSLKRATEGGGGISSGRSGPSSQQWPLDSRLDDHNPVYHHQGSDDVSWNSARQTTFHAHKEAQRNEDIGTDLYGDVTFYPWKAAATDQTLQQSTPSSPNHRVATLENHALATHIPRYTDYSKPTDMPPYPTAGPSTLQHASMLLSPLLSNSAATQVKGLNQQSLLGGGNVQTRVHLAGSGAAPSHLLAYTGAAFQQRPMWGLTAAGVQPTAIPYAATHPSLTAARGAPPTAVSANGRYPPQYYARPNAVISRRPVRT
eukprot:Gregarina_sp_Poly_1__538@NODE_112_length_13900_cov_236_895034_g99_i0_p2_GENE_NODE_112_length_13900_cov_236_895034_g99_i0NODE_112_length_13900_cov_236_895034_g99_i0_p2_ORF_typecomplete_len664_score95_16RRM_1/PF00076_22/4_9e19RRM_1/PF00076_22/1_6e16RRM_1/PF00076_22/1_6e18RRM_5/PF13893_6/0_0015RRM_5/PF13893_6/0_00014RRM_5/PF13893_6/0_025RRM_5/PF13893_6/1e04RRM_7/PF16367_5/0_00013RRM_7/PF16367_5/0_1RRM_7/PF16367_5/0_0041DUF1866/PF08952_11/0_00091DUF1866/PF08952_11/0_3DUF1866/PF08952_11/0_9Limkainb1/